MTYNIATRIGHLVEARVATKLGNPVQLTFQQAERIIDILLKDGKGYTDKIWYGVTNSDIKRVELTDSSFQIYGKGIEAGITARTSPFLTAVDLDDIGIAHDGINFLVRPSFTVCATINGELNPDHPVFSKIWLRIIAINNNDSYKSPEIEQLIIDKIRNIGADFIQPCIDVYYELLKSVLGESLTIEKKGTIEIVSIGESEKQFDSIFDTITSHPDRMIEPEKSRKKFRTLVDIFSKINSMDENLIVKFQKSPMDIINFWNHASNDRDYEIYILQDPDGHRGIYLGSFDEDGAKFVGFARESIPSLAKLASHGKIRISKSAPSVSSAILANDLVIGL